MREVVLIVHNVRSALNVGSLLRTADGLGVRQVFLTGYTPYPTSSWDERLPHIARKVHAHISKSALGAEVSVNWKSSSSISPVLEDLTKKGYEIACLEQYESAVPLDTYSAPAKVALIVGSEVGGIEKTVLVKADAVLEIPMRGQKESFNVAAAAAMALYQLALLDKNTT